MMGGPGAVGAAGEEISVSLGNVLYCCLLGFRKCKTGVGNSGKIIDCLYSEWKHFNFAIF